MEVGQTVRYRGTSMVLSSGGRVETGALGEVVGVHQIEEMWFAVQWEGMTRPTFHLETELEPTQT